jgi:hypothetical protein
MINKYLDGLLAEDLEDLQGLIRDIRDFKLYQNTDQLAALVGMYFVRLYARPTEWNSCYPIGSALIYCFGNEKKTLENYPKQDIVINLSPQGKSHAVAYWQRRLKWWQARLMYSRFQGLEVKLELDAIAKCNEILELN